MQESGGGVGSVTCSVFLPALIRVGFVCLSVFRSSVFLLSVFRSSVFLLFVFLFVCSSSVCLFVLCLFFRFSCFFFGDSCIGVSGAGDSEVSWQLDRGKHRPHCTYALDSESSCQDVLESLRSH